MLHRHVKRRFQNFLENHPLTKLTIKEGGEHYFHTEEDKEFIKEWILKNID